MPGVLSATLKLLQIDLNTRTFQDLENALNSKVGKWIGASSMSMHRYHCHCHQVFLWSPEKSPRLKIIGTVSSWIYFGANKMDFKAIFKQSAKKEMLLCQRKAVANFYALWNVWWKFVVNVAKLCAHLESCPLMKV